MSEKLDIKKLIKDEVCQKWITYSTAEDSKKPTEWFREKQSFWEENQEHLELSGFTYGTNIGGALDDIEIMQEEGLEGSLLIVKIGNESRPASPDDINLAHKTINEVLDGVKGVRVIVTHHAFDISKISLPQLRSLQSAVLASTDATENVNPIIDLDI
jgi:hypothetical protein